MALGKISGEMLKDNLTRNGIDLAFDTDLLYLSADDRRIGINTSSPSYALTVVGTINSTILQSGQLTVDNVDINGNIISSVTGPVRIIPANELDNYISLESAVNILGDLDVTGSISLTGNITIGDTNLDSIGISADFVSNLIPNAPNTYDLGSADKPWRTVYAESISSSSAIIDCGTY